MQLSEQDTHTINLINAFGLTEADIKKLETSISIKKSERDSLEKQLNNFNFYEHDISVNKRLIKEINMHITELKKYEYTLQYKLERAKNAFSKNFSAEIEELQQLFQEVGIHFPEKLVNDYTALEKFHHMFVKEQGQRSEIVIEMTLAELEKIRKELELYNEKRNKALAALKNSDALKKFKLYHIDLAKKEAEIARLEQKLEDTRRICLLYRTSGKISHKKDLKQEIYA